ncbi:MAG: hypothetical protein JOY79_00370, partial [Acidobacteriaceae bacterium]|nr:hypothetical protein [Acidobacteriaceae bacterium]
MSWRAALLAPLLFLAGAFHSSSTTTDPGQLHREVKRLESELAELKHENAMPVLVLNRHRQSICFIYGEYSLGGNASKEGRAHIQFSGTGFVAAEGLVATNRHVA